MVGHPSRADLDADGARTERERNASAPRPRRERLVALRPDWALVGPDDALVAAQAEGVANRVSVDPPAVAVGADAVLLQRRAEAEDAALLGLDFVHFEVEVELLG